MKFTIVAFILSLISFSAFADCRITGTKHDEVNAVFERKGYTIVESKNDADILLTYTENEEAFKAHLFTNSHEWIFTLTSAEDISKKIEFKSTVRQFRPYSVTSTDPRYFESEPLKKIAEKVIPNCDQLFFN